jgi:hypothetical protein
MRFESSAWTIVAAPSPGREAELNSVVCTSTTGCWAAGSGLSSGGAYRTLISHNDGTAWTRVKSPNPA